MPPCSRRLRCAHPRLPDRAGEERAVGGAVPPPEKCRSVSRGQCLLCSHPSKQQYVSPAACPIEKLVPPRHAGTLARCLGASPFGILDLAGNAWEWTSSLYGSYPYSATDGREDLKASGHRVFRGGSWSNFPRNLRSADRFGADPSIRVDDLGFRCAQDER